jgi:lactate permease
LGIAGVLTGLIVAHAADGWKAVRKVGWAALIIGLAMGIGQYAAATSGLWNIGAFIGGLVGLVVAFPLALRQRGEIGSSGKLNWKALLIALSGYGVLILLTLGVQLIPAVRDVLGGVKLTLVFPEMETSLGYITPAGPGREIPILRHAGMILVVSALLGSLIYWRAGWYQKGALPRILGGTLQRVITSSVGIASMVAMAVIMQHAGMTDALARGLSSAVGGAFPALSPWMGAVGAFMTGSNTNSNVVFAALQMRTAELLGLPVAIILAAQTAGGALGSVIAPTKVVVGASTAGMAGREGEVMRKLLLYVGLLILVISLLAVGGVLMLK